MELGLSLGSEASISPNNIRDQKHEETQKEEEEEVQGKERVNTKEMEMMHGKEHESKKGIEVFMKEMEHNNDNDNRIYPVQLDLLPNTPVLRTHLHNSLLIPSPSLHGNSEVAKCSIKLATIIGRGLDVKRVTDRGEEAVEGDKYVPSSPQNSTGASSFQMDLSLFNGNNNNINKVDRGNRYSQRRASDQEDDNNDVCARKKLRLSKQQSSFLEESFKEHSTLNPKQKLALAKHLNLRPRQVEVWFQNRRARTKLKQTEVDCEYLRRCCETLTEENRRLHKELQELRALKNSNPSHKQLPATTLTMCPSCEKIVTTTTTNINNNNNNSVFGPISKTREFQLVRTRFYHFSQT